MKLRKEKFVLSYFYYTIACILWLCGIFLLYSKIKTEFHHKINDIWNNAIAMDYSNRLSNIDNKVIRKANKNYSLYEKMYFESDDYLIELDYEDVEGDNQLDREFKMYQTIMLVVNPLDIHKLDSLFNQLLAAAHINAKTAIIYTVLDKGKMEEKIISEDHSLNNISFYEHAFATNPFYTGINNTICLQGFVEYSKKNFLHFTGPITIIWIFIGFLIFTGFFITIKRIKKNQRKKRIEANNRLKEMIESEKKLIRITYHSRLREIETADDKIMLTPLQGKLFASLLANNKYFQDYETLYEELWGTKSTDKKNLEQQRYSLEEKLRMIPGLHIITIPRMGYQLIMDDNIRLEVDDS